MALCFPVVILLTNVKIGLATGGVVEHVWHPDAPHREEREVDVRRDLDRRDGGLRLDRRDGGVRGERRRKRRRRQGRKHRRREAEEKNVEP